MAASRALPSSYQNPNFNASLRSPKPSSNVVAFDIKASTLKKKKKKQNSISCEVKRFDYTHNSIIEPVPSPIHIFQNGSEPQVAMASESAVQKVKKVCLFYCAETRSLAKKVAAQSDSIELRSITWRTSERMEDEGDVATAFTLARALSYIPISMGGPTSLVIYDIHALQRFYFGDNILPCFESGIPLLKSRLQHLPDSENISIAFPDDGAWKRFHKQLQHFPTVLIIDPVHYSIRRDMPRKELRTIHILQGALNSSENRMRIVCAKVREGDQGIVRIKEGDPRGRHVVIVDDLVQSGGTLIECQKVLATHGAAKISAYVTHGIFPNRSWQRFQSDNGGNLMNGLAYFWITDSCPLTVNDVMQNPPFEVLSLAGSIAATLQI